MLLYLLRRLLAAVPVIAIVAFVVFSLLHLAPGDPAAMIAGDHATPEEVAMVRETLGLDRAFLPRFLDWLGQLAQGDLGTSIFTSLPVSTMIGQRIGPTLALMTVALAITLSLSIPLSVLSARRPGGLLDRVLMGFAVLSYSLPVFLTGYLLAYFVSLKTGLLPVQGYVPPEEGLGLFLAHLLLPGLALSGAYFALIARTGRAAMLEVLRQDYIRTGRAKGLGAVPLLFHHALKNAAIPIATVVGMGVASLISGAVVTESIFTIPGLGRLTAEAVLRRDYPVIQAMVLLFSVIYLVVNLVVDLVYGLLDPRIRL
ncbi:ABC transporter permease [Roseomonas sp. 18066]|uniref:ABC transporter permease n=1 Tax=Roseomonas sp. 18066 TaxID=2681412 RepID=UPI00135B87D1|nr:ABC transporter permease [Roseomonas sp. 18066]